MIHFEERGLVGVATIDRQERRNALNHEMCDELRRSLQRSNDLRAIVITGAGTAFCSGADLVTRFEAEGDSATDTFRPAFEDVLDAIVAYPSPVIAAINGPAIGAGMQLAVACDLRVVAPNATFAIPAARLGVMISSANVERLAALVGPAAARDVLLTARALDADEADSLGLVQRRAPDALAGARRLADELATLAPLSLAGHKRALALVAASATLSEAARAELADLEAAAFASHDLQEGLAAFAEKRTPTFEGR